MCMCRSISVCACTYLPALHFAAARASADSLPVASRPASSLAPTPAWVVGAINVIQQNPANPDNKNKGSAAKQSPATSSRGILSGNMNKNNRKRTLPHPRDVQTVDVLKLNANANPSEYSVRELCEGSFLTTNGLKDLVQSREMEIERTKKANLKANAQRTKTLSPSSSRPGSPMPMPMPMDVQQP